mmetsp:Transcript_14587/g.35199  ORF Transcript_14587/g.35199 Transcript_14587/m.35199 type:complete len:392 (+) Transcript_14587:570-1745(+)
MPSPHGAAERGAHQREGGDRVRLPWLDLRRQGRIVHGHPAAAEAVAGAGHGAELAPRVRHPLPHRSGAGHPVGAAGERAECPGGGGQAAAAADPGAGPPRLRGAGHPPRPAHGLQHAAGERHGREPRAVHAPQQRGQARERHAGGAGDGGQAGGERLHRHLEGGPAQGQVRQPVHAVPGAQPDAPHADHRPVHDAHRGVRRAHHPGALPPHGALPLHLQGQAAQAHLPPGAALVLAHEPELHPGRRPDLPAQAGAPDRGGAQLQQQDVRPGVLHAHQGGRVRQRLPPLDRRDRGGAPGLAQGHGAEAARAGGDEGGAAGPLPLAHRQLQELRRGAGQHHQGAQGAEGGEPGGSGGGGGGVRPQHAGARGGVDRAAGCRAGGGARGARRLRG